MEEDNANTHSPSTWVHLHNHITISPFFFFNRDRASTSQTLLLPSEGMLKVLQSNERMWTLVRSDSMTYPTDGLIEAWLPPSRGRIEHCPREPLPFLLRAGKLPRRSAAAESRLRVEWIHRSAFPSGGEAFLDSTLLCFAGDGWLSVWKDLLTRKSKGLVPNSTWGQNQFIIFNLHPHMSCNAVLFPSAVWHGHEPFMSLILSNSFQTFTFTLLLMTHVLKISNWRAWKYHCSQVLCINVS